MNPTECPTCGARSPVRRYRKNPKPVTHIGCGDTWHPLAGEDYSELTEAVAELIAQAVDKETATTAVIESLSMQLKLTETAAQLETYVSATCTCLRFEVTHLASAHGGGTGALYRLPECTCQRLPEPHPVHVHVGVEMNPQWWKNPGDFPYCLNKAHTAWMPGLPRTHCVDCLNACGEMGPSVETSGPRAALKCALPPGHPQRHEDFLGNRWDRTPELCGQRFPYASDSSDERLNCAYPAGHTAMHNDRAGNRWGRATSSIPRCGESVAGATHEYVCGLAFGHGGCHVDESGVRWAEAALCLISNITGAVCARKLGHKGKHKDVTGEKWR